MHKIITGMILRRLLTTTQIQDMHKIHLRYRFAQNSDIKLFQRTNERNPRRFETAAWSHRLPVN